ncbi:L-glutamine:scyllo-inosose aminotransferase [Anatilimnocola aggregata]|uniref:L-glutamine:scyllo-inosose aminotransferase n=1 Tax=Anatilimnocola aggregata TaxID=2528021 RepID=A0A517Y9V9_9BACT|nr:DegT/DnrJ/EryC1/StrS aminotransferase family protein [Anatilimnocola aggregata]QDU26952.1 L-glutamine:scyllo-inosose aminotransferase [Anatilimnocola aggregata]
MNDGAHRAHKPAFPAGPPTWPLLDDDVRAAMLACYASGDWGRYEGAHSAAFVQALAEKFQTEQAILCASGTIAVELALRGLKVGAGDEVILAGYDFPGNFRAIEAVGARPVLIDVVKNGWTIDLQQLAAAKAATTKAVIASHLHGHLAPMRALLEQAHSLGLKVLEDACQVPGALIGGRPAGSWGDVGVLSFGGSKLLTAGRGGAILTSQADVAQRIRSFTFRGNEAYPLSELQAAVLLPQLDKLAARTHTRAVAAARLIEELRDVSKLQAGPANDPADLSAFYKVAWRYQTAEGGVQPDCSNPSRDRLICALQAEGIAIDAGFRGFNKRSANRCRVVGELSQAQAAAEATLVLHHPILLQNQEQTALLAATIRKVVTQA